MINRFLGKKEIRTKEKVDKARIVAGKCDKEKCSEPLKCSRPKTKKMHFYCKYK
jgi:hypothetical protein